MEDNQEKNTGYTGEYGNSVEPAEASEDIANTADTENTADTTYRHSYRNGGEVTHSGDYYESSEKSNQAETVNHQQENSQAGVQMNQQGWQDGRQGQANPFYQNQGYGQRGPAPMQPPKTPKNKKNTSGSPFWKKVLISAACAAVFGIVAGTCFQGVRYVSDRFLPSQSSSRTKLKTTTEGSDTTDKQDKNTQDTDENKSSQVPVTEVGALDVSGIAEQTMPAIVAITSTTQGANYYDLFGREYVGKETTSAGSGFIVAQNENELLITTNNHVIKGAKTISVQFIDGEIYEAAVKGTDSANDLAVIAVAVKNIKEETMKKIAIADLGSSEDLKVGEMVIAIGNALGYGQSVTVGYVSAKDREISASDEDQYSGSGNNNSAMIKAIQTDAAINPGNSGGALINMRGEVIGINSAKIADSTVEGIGYAIPITVANPIIEDLMNKEVLKDSDKGYLGISCKTVTEAATAFNIPNGVQVMEVAKGGAADKAGILVGDIVTSINNMEVRSSESLSEKANSYKKGTEVELKVQRSDNGSYKEKTFKVTLQGKDSLDSLEDSTNNNNGNSDGNNNSGNGNSGNGDSGNGDSGNNGSGGDNSGNNGSGDGYSQDDGYGDDYEDGFGDFFDQFFN